MPEIGDAGVGLDDTPVDGETAKGITSNWAYDHKANASAHHGKTELDDSPVDGETAKGISSNWAFDHKADPGAHGEVLYPWLIDIDIFHTPKSQVNFNTISLLTSCLYNGWRVSSGAQNDEIAWDVVLGAGTWSVELIHITLSQNGIYSIQFDSVEKGTIDGYSAGTVFNVMSSATGIVVPTTKKIEFKIKMANKNASSANYYGQVNSIRLMRTA